MIIRVTALDLFAIGAVTFREEKLGKDHACIYSVLCMR